MTIEEMMQQQMTYDGTGSGHVKWWLLAPLHLFILGVLMLLYIPVKIFQMLGGGRS